MPSTIRVLLADDSREIRRLFRRAIDKMDDIEVVGEACDGREAVEQALGLRPDIVLMDIVMPNQDGIEATQQIALEAPEIHVIGLSMHNDARIQTAMLRAGAKAFVLKDEVFDKLHTTLRSVI